MYRRISGEIMWSETKDRCYDYHLLVTSIHYAGVDAAAACLRA
jgi:hypothetical protein